MQYDPPVRANVRGDWMRGGVAYPALVTRRWNGWAVPSFSAETMRRVVEDQAAMLADEDAATTLEWRGDAVVLTDPSWDVPETVRPGDDGTYVFDVGWCWETVGDVDPGQPTAEQLEAFERLRESVRCDSHQRLVLEDGSHRFSLMADLGERAGDGETRVFREVGCVLISREGVASVVPVDGGSP